MTRETGASDKPYCRPDYRSANLSVNRSANWPASAMIAAAGLGTRMRPLTLDRPKALVELAGKTLLDHQLDRLAEAGVKYVVVNVHHFADLVEAHLAARAGPPNIKISDEREALLETGGGLVKAGAMLGADPFYVMNVDAVWQGHDTAMQDLAAFFAQLKNPAAVLLLAQKKQTLGLASAGDFHLQEDGRLQRPAQGEQADHYYAGVQVFDPGLLAGKKPVRFSTNLLWDQALSEGRLYGLELDGYWMHVGDPTALDLAQKRLLRSRP